MFQDALGGLFSFSREDQWEQEASHEALTWPGTLLSIPRAPLLGVSILEIAWPANSRCSDITSAGGTPRGVGEASGLWPSLFHLISQ